MEIIVNFLYTNDAAAIQSQTYSDSFIYNMISICDQYFITRLRTVFEYILIDKLSIKRCGEMLELSCMYNCNILKQVALDFIVQNSARILEMRALDSVDLIVLKKINEHYRNTFNCSLIEQRYDAPSDDVVESFVDDFVIDLTYKHSKKTKSITEKITNIPQTKRQYEKDAIGSFKKKLVSDELLLNNSNSSGYKKPENSFVQEAEKISQDILSKSKQWTKVTTDKPTKKFNVLAALKANEILKNDSSNIIDNFVELKVSNKNDPELLLVSPKKCNIENFDEYTNRPAISLANFTPQANRRRISQKQRKLSQNSSIDEQSPNISTLKPTTPIPIPSSTEKKLAWGSNNESASSHHSFADIMMKPSDSLDNSLKIVASCNNASIPKMTEVLVSPFSLKQSQKKKQIGPSLPLAATQSSDSYSFMNIQKDEKKERAYFEKLKTKSFVLTQIEETAIDELKKFYNIEKVFDESIQIDRVLHKVQSNMNFAVWHQKQQQQH